MDVLLPLVFYWHRHGRPDGVGDLWRDGRGDFLLGLLTARLLRGYPRRWRPLRPGRSLWELLRMWLVYRVVGLLLRGHDLIWALVRAKIWFKGYRYERVLSLRR